ncbi:MAG: hypothetical protein DRP90_07440 [Planctomycetota bacterium]|nr:MAG: hypothetical protein DRP90_07440 [Planctomycetota bacterium]
MSSFPRAGRARLLLFLLPATLYFLSALHAEEVIPGTARDFYLRGCRFFEQGDYRKAADEFSNAISLDPSMDDARLKRGICRLNLDEFVGAMDDFTTLVKKDPRNFRAYYWRAVARRKLGEVKGAFVDLDAALKVNPAYIPAWELKGDICFDKGDYQGALTAYGEAVKWGGGADSRLKRARAELRLGMAKAAIADCDAVIKALPSLCDAFYLRGDAHKLMGNYDQAERDYTSGMEKDAWRDNPHAFLKRGLVRILMRKFSAAVADLRTAAAAPGPFRPRYVVHLCCALLLSGRERDARKTIASAGKDIAAAVGKENYDSKWGVLVGYLLDERGEKDLIDAVIADIDDAAFASVAYYTVGGRKLAVGQKDRALDCLFRSFDLGSPEFPVSLQAKKLYDELQAGRMGCPPKEAAPPAPSPSPSPTPKEE